MAITVHNILDGIKRDAINKFDSTKSYKDVIEAIIVVDEISHTGRREGLLALEEKFAYGSTGTVADDIAYCVMLVVDGTEPELVAEIATNQYLASKYQGNDALKQYILIRGILLVQEGANPRLIEELLMSLLPNDVKEHAKKTLDYDRDKRDGVYKKEIIDKYNTWQGAKIEDEELAELVKDVDALLLKLDDKDIQRALREIECEHIVKCLIYSSQQVRQHLLENMSSRLSTLLIDDMFNTLRYLDLHLDSSKRAMQEIKGVIQKLIDSCEIMSIY